MAEKILTTFAVLLLAVCADGQSWDSIKRDASCLWGEGCGSTVAEADRNALTDLTSRITVHVSSNFEIAEEEDTKGQKTDSKTYISNRVKTYSQATLNNTERIIISNEPNAHVGRWIRRAEVAKIFESRLVKARDMVETALRAETMGKVDDALRNYYWAFSLVRSLQHPTDATYTTDDGKQHILMNWLKERMDALFDDVQITAVSRKGDDIDLAITYKGRPVTSIDYTFFDGRDWSRLISAADGRGVLELAQGNQADSYQLKIEYEYLSESHIDKETESVLAIVNSTSMRKSFKHIKAATAARTALPTVGTGLCFSKLAPSQTARPKTVAAPQAYARTLNTVLASLVSKRYDAPPSCFTPNGLDVYTKLLKYGAAKVIGEPSPRYYESAGGVVARGVRMSFSFKTGMRKSFVESFVFYFDKSGKVSNITFGLGDAAETDILYKGAWSETARKAIMEFLENYKTAYALKRLDYIKTIFDDDAVIIVGYVASSAKGTSGDGLSLNARREIKTNRYTKDQYIRNLRRCFDSNEFINIRFANNDVIKLGKGGETYAIQIAQDYYSSSYGDKGYLFLMVDINDPMHPLIRLRTWQPEKDPNFGLYGPGDFK